MAASYAGATVINIAVARDVILADTGGTNVGVAMDLINVVITGVIITISHVVVSNVCVTNVVVANEVVNALVTHAVPTKTDTVIGQMIRRGHLRRSTEVF